jgi:glutamine synthetase type III
MAMTTGFSDMSKGVSDSYARLSEQNCGVKETVAAYGNRSSDQHAALARDICSLGKDITVQAAGHYGSLQLEASKNTGAIQLQAACNAKESLLEQSKWFALAEKTAMINKCELEAKLAACCCEIKEVVTGTANATQSLIQATEATRVRDALSAATTENAILRLRREEHHHHHGGHHGGSRRGRRS